MQTLESRVHEMAYYQAVYKQENLQDEAVLLNLYSVVNQRSILASTVIIVSAVVQVVFIRKLFSVPHSKMINAGI